MKAETQTVAFATEEIEVEAVADRPFKIIHGLGRPVLGWVVIWKNAPCDVYELTPQADTSQELWLIPTGTASLRIALL